MYLSIKNSNNGSHSSHIFQRFMERFAQRILLCLVAGLLFSIQPTKQDRSVSSISSSGREFVPFISSYPALLTFTTKKQLYCSMECNKRVDCRTFDFDSNSGQCRLWDGDTTTGSIVSSPSKPQSVVGSIQLSSSIYANIYNQSCTACAQSRYLVCNVNTNTCQCPTKTFWNGSICSVQLLANQTCSRVDACRSDFNLTCQPNCDFTYRCSLRKSFQFYICSRIAFDITKQKDRFFIETSEQLSISCSYIALRHVFLDCCSSSYWRWSNSGRLL
jgi:hypothetical protein